ncbi:MAG: hypothetical protein BZY81_05600 [SAR202 cluster bacterium Io17-Chloro-G4]|nr:MAG: hypothetical protein BZY81_05600 [SAR202 cluster bacterium Io17-Chloro-G4]
MTSQKPLAHLVGSVPLSDTESVFRTVAGHLGSHMKRIPDGETGDRWRWIFWQREMLVNHPDMEEDPDIETFKVVQWDGQIIRDLPYIRFKPGVDPSGVKFEAAYAGPAIESFQTYQRLKEEGVIGPDTLFQVCIPTPMATTYMYISPSARQAYIPVYEKALEAASKEILDAIPHDRLSIQWDVCQEVLVFEDYFIERPQDYKQQIFSELVRIGQLVPESVDMGYHLCYGSPRDEHLVQPKDMGILVEISNGVIEGLGRRLDFLHLPVPKDRTDAGYFQPLQELKAASDTEIYLGLIHFDDQAGDAQRMATAKQFIPSFGVATECGWGRTDPTRVESLLQSHAVAVRVMEG